MPSPYSSNPRRNGPPFPPFWPPWPDQKQIPQATDPELVVIDILHAIEFGIFASTAVQMNGVLQA